MRPESPDSPLAVQVLADYLHGLNDLSRDDLERIINKITHYNELVDALKWYVENDDTHNDIENEFWLKGKQNAIEVLDKIGVKID